jgi:NADH-quinone oxidoreductase subunit L
VVIGVVGIAAAYMVYTKKKVKAIEPTVLANAWYYDKGVSALMGGPGRKSFDAVAWFDAHIIDGAVNGTGKLVQGMAGVVRKGQSGLVRTYAALIGIGAVAVLAWFFLRGVIQ